MQKREISRRGLKKPSVVIPARQDLDDGASSYVEEAATLAATRTKRVATQEVYEARRSLARRQARWDDDLVKRLSWSREGRSREYRFPEHFGLREAVDAPSKYPLGSEHADVIAE